MNVSQSTAKAQQPSAKAPEQIHCVDPATRAPPGVVAAITPWNDPFQNIINPIIPALMAGNAIVLKPTEWVAWSSARFIDALRDVVKDAGHDPNLIQAVQGFGETGAALARSAVDLILFIGSV